MCQSGPEFTDVVLTRCHHGCFHLFMGKQTLHLTPNELIAMAREISRGLDVLDHEQHPIAPPPASDRWSSN